MPEDPIRPLDVDVFNIDVPQGGTRVAVADEFEVRFTAPSPNPAYFKLAIYKQSPRELYKMVTLISGGALTAAAVAITRVDVVTPHGTLGGHYAHRVVGLPTPAAPAFLTVQLLYDPGTGPSVKDAIEIEIYEAAGGS